MYAATRSRASGNLLKDPPPDDLIHAIRVVAGGEALFISEATVETHVSHVLTKLDLHDRAGAVVVAYESGLAGPSENPGA